MKCGTDYVFAVSLALGLENTLVHKSRGSSGWSGYRQLGTPEIKTVAATSPTPGRLDVFAIGTDDALWHKSGAYPYFPEGPC